MVKEVEKDGFEEVIGEGIVLVDFFAEWCGPCKLLAPELEKAAEAMEGKATVLKANVEKLQEKAGAYDVMGVPTLVVFKDGEEVVRASGMHDSGAIVQLVELNV